MLNTTMAAIPVPVHFDGHNINIITEDSPSTCKNRTKGMNYGKKNNNKNKKRNNQNGKYGNKTQLLNKRLPNANSKVKSPTLVTSTEDINDTVISHTNKENIDGLISPSQASNPIQPPPQLQPPKVLFTPNALNKGSISPLPLVPKPIENISQTLPIQSNPNNNPALVVKHENGKTLMPPLPLPPPPLPHMINNNRNNNVMHNHPHTHTHNHNVSALNNKRTRLPLSAAEQNSQLIAGGLDPNEFGSHDDIGFDDDDSQNNGGGNNNGKDRQNLYKTELCREWSTSGWCYYNKRCSFAHGLQELRPVFRSKKWRTKRCRNWHTTGYCPYEHRCQFLHDQSPPRRISDYATANARALVAAQQRMQPLYFHYQVDCNRDETSEDDEDKNKSKPNTPKQNTPSIGPRLKRKPNRNMNKVPLIASNAQNHMHPHYVNQHLNPGLRMVRQRKNEKNMVNKKIMKPNLKKKQKAKTYDTRINMNMNGSMMNNKLQNRKKKPKDAVITPFNPVSATYGGGVTNAHTQSYEIAAQQLGLYNPSQPLTLPNLGLGALPNIMPTIPSLGALPPLPMANINHINATFQTLPPSIDPSLYLSLTPSPPQSPRGVNIHGNAVVNKKKLADAQNNLTVDVPVSLTPSPPSLAAAHPNGNNGLIPHHVDLAQMSQMSQQQVQLQLAKQQQTLQVLHAKVQEVAQQQAAQHAEQQATVQALLARNVGNKSNTPIAHIDGAMLESLLPSDEALHKEAPSITNITIKSDTRFNIKNTIKPDASALGHGSVPNNMKKDTVCSGHGSILDVSKHLPPIPPIPPPLQLQTSINSVVTGAVAAAINATPTPTACTGAQNNAIKTTFGYPTAPGTNTTTTTTIKQMPGISQIPIQPCQPIQPLQNTNTTTTTTTSVTTPTVYDMHRNTYAQQAHTHAHAYASAHAHSAAVPYNYQQPMAYSQHPHTYSGTGNHTPQHLGLQLQPLQPQIGYPPFYAPSPDFQDLSVPQQPYYSANYTHPQARHHY